MRKKIDWTKPLLLFGHGEPDTPGFKPTVVAETKDGGALVHILGKTTPWHLFDEYGIHTNSAKGPQDGSALTIRNEPERVSRFMNIYRDTGGLLHTSAAKAMQNIRSWGVHEHMLELIYEDDKLVDVNLVGETQ